MTGAERARRQARYELADRAAKMFFRFEEPLMGDVPGTGDEAALVRIFDHAVAVLDAHAPDGDEPSTAYATRIADLVETTAPPDAWMRDMVVVSRQVIAQAGEHFTPDAVRARTTTVLVDGDARIEICDDELALVCHAQRIPLAERPVQLQASPTAAVVRWNGGGARWLALDGTALRDLPEVDVLAASPAGFAIGNRQRPTIRIYAWSGDERAAIQLPLTEDEIGAWALALSVDGTRLAVADGGQWRHTEAGDRCGPRQVRVFAVPGGECLEARERDGDRIAFSPDGDILIVDGDRWAIATPPTPDRR